MRKRCKRKVWNKVNPIAHAIAGAAVVSQSDMNALRVRELAAIEAFASVADSTRTGLPSRSAASGPATPTCTKSYDRH